MLLILPRSYLLWPRYRPLSDAMFDNEAVKDSARDPDDPVTPLPPGLSADQLGTPQVNHPRQVSEPPDDGVL
jgi:hypothetical protein